MNYSMVRSFRDRKGRSGQPPSAPTLRICVDAYSVLSAEGTPLPLLKGMLLARLDAEVRCCEFFFFPIQRIIFFKLHISAYPNVNLRADLMYSVRLKH